MSSISDLVRTVGGDIPSAALGHIQCHEHIWLERGPSFEVNPALVMDDFDASLAELKRYKAAGGDSIIDAQPGGFGRNLTKLRALSAASGVNIIAVTGCHKLCFLEDASAFSGKTSREIAADFVREVREGVPDVSGNIRTGMLKLALDCGGLDNPAYAALYPAVTRAAAETGAAVMVHTEKGNDIEALIRFFESYGVSAQRLMICHLDRTNADPEYHLRVLATGATLCYDSVHRYKYVSDKQELSLIGRMLCEGFAAQLVLGLDTTNQRLRAYHATDMGLDTILTEFIPKLVESGARPQEVEALCRTNAARLLPLH